MAVKALAQDGDGTNHLVLGLIREDIDALLRGEVITIEGGIERLSEQSEIVLMFEETTEGIRLRLPASLRPS